MYSLGYTPERTTTREERDFQGEDKKKPSPSATTSSLSVYLSKDFFFSLDGFLYLVGSRRACVFKTTLLSFEIIEFVRIKYVLQSLGLF